ncbi:MAG: calcium-binding protein [Candidatus Staskawiczbacteria bacterium]|nr:calcium-binding protein [Candidatus Staskawiczbacteria bacterium]
MRKCVPVRLTAQELESRQLLSASPVQYVFNGPGQLTINGSSEADKISVQMQGDADTSSATVQVIVGYGRQAATKTFEAVTNVSIFGNAGNDHIKISGANLSEFFGVWTQVNGGDGNDVIRIVNFDGGVSADGGSGNDLIDASHAFGRFALVGSASFRFLSGGTGNDRIMGSSYSDYLQGGAGDDVINAGAGNDWLAGDSGKNILRGGTGDDTFSVTSLNGTYAQAVADGNVGGFDKVIGGVGNDTIYGDFNSSMGEAEFGLRSTSSVENFRLNDFIGGGG